MRVTRVLAPPPLAHGALVELPSAAGAHLARVLRMGVGDELAVFDGAGHEFEARIESIRRDRVSVRLHAPRAGASESTLRITLLQGIARGEKMDLILQKATELGVARIVPVLAARSNVRLSAKTAVDKLEHWRRVVTSACEQCGRSRLPELRAPVHLEAAVGQDDANLRLLMDSNADAPSLPGLLKERGQGAVSLLVGPEGGLDENELQQARSAGYRACRMGPRVLRTETAGLAAIAILQALAGDLA